MPGTRFSGQTVDALFIATMNNSLYALDADQPGSAPLWQVNLGQAVPVNHAGAFPANFTTGISSGAGAPRTGTVWALRPGVLHAFNAEDISQELWNSDENRTRDGLADGFHFEQYTVAAGKPYVPDAGNSIAVFGLLPK